MNPLPRPSYEILRKATLPQTYVLTAMKWKFSKRIFRYATFQMTPCFTATVVCPCTRQWISRCSSHVRAHSLSLDFFFFLCEMYILYHSGTTLYRATGAHHRPQYTYVNTFYAKKDTPSTQASDKGGLAPTCVTAYLIL